MSDEELLSRHERERLLLKLDKEFAFAGATIPSTVDLDGEVIKLRSFVVEMAKKRGRLTPDETMEADRVASLLRKKRRELVGRIANEEMTGARARELYQTARGIDRALDTLYATQMPKPSIKEESMKAKRDDARRWLSLVKKIYSHEEARKRG